TRWAPTSSGVPRPCWSTPPRWPRRTSCETGRQPPAVRPGVLTMNQPLLILALLAALSCCQAAPAQERSSTVAQSTPGYSQLTISNDHGSVIDMHGPDNEFPVVRAGQVLSGDRTRRDGDHLRILDESGATIFD